MPQRFVIYSFIGLGLLSISTREQAFGKQINTPQSLLDLRHSPSPYECAILSAHAYQDNLQQGDPVIWKDPSSQQVHRIYGWTVVHVLTEDENDELLSKAFTQLGLPYGYKGVIYVNHHKQQCVLAHRGTNIKNVSALKTDAGAIAQNIIQGQERNMPRILEKAISSAQEKNYSLTVTGHSLGGWLAQISAFLAKSQYPEIHLKAITFDSPGAKPMLEQINPRINPIGLDQLDITNYLSAPNLINACNPHIGTVYRIVFEAFQAKPAHYTLQTHALSTLIRAFNPNTGDAYRCLQVNSWPIISKKGLQVGKSLLTGDKLHAIIGLCQLVQRCVNQEALGEYSGFFKLAKKVNQYHPKGMDMTSKDAFDLNYKYHYNTAPFLPHQLHIRHFPDNVQLFLKHLQAGLKPYVTLAERERWLQAIQLNQQTGWVSMLDRTDLRRVCDRLLGMLSVNPKLADEAHAHLYMTKLLIPPAVSFFVGRFEEQQMLGKSLQIPQDLIIAPPITGPGGIGKTQLALRVLHQQVAVGQYAHVFWITADSQGRLLDAYLRIADEMGIYVDKKDPDQAVQTIRGHLQNLYCLYVFDDAPDIKSIRDYLPLTQGHVLITSRNSSPTAWPDSTLPMEPLCTQSASALAVQLDYGQIQEEKEALQDLLRHMPRYPLMLVQLFSILACEGYTPTTVLNAMRQSAPIQQEQAIITWLADQPHARVGYEQSAHYLFKTSLERLAQEAQGQEALQLISQLAYLDSKGIPLDWILTWDREDDTPFMRKTRQALALLERYSFIQWDKAKQQIYIHPETQLMVRHLYPQTTLEPLVNRLVDYVGDESVAFQQTTKWTSLLPHGKMLFERLDTTQYPASAYKLTQYLYRAAGFACLFQEQLQWAKNNLTIAEQRYPHQNHADIAESLTEVGYACKALGKYEESLDYGRRALAIREALFEGNHPDVARSLNNVGLAYGELGKHREALDYIKRALLMKEALFGENHLDVAKSLTNVGWVYGELGKYTEQLGYLKRALAMKETLLEENNPTIALSLNNLGHAYRKLGKYQESLDYHKRALAMREAFFEGNHRSVAQSLNQVGDAYRELGKHQESLDYGRRALAMREALFEGDHPDLAISLNSVGTSLEAVGNLPEALQHKQAGLAMRQRLFIHQDHPAIAQSLNDVGALLIKLDKPGEGIEHSKQGLTMRERLFQGQDHPDIAQSFNSLGLGFTALKQYEKAVDAYRQAVNMALRVYRRAHPQLTKYLNHLIETLPRLEALLIQQVKDEVVPLCIEVLGEGDALTQKLLAVDQETNNNP